MSCIQPPEGIWLPMITPFSDGKLDENSLRNITRHYCNVPISGFVLAATTGEGLLLSSSELKLLCEIVSDELVKADTGQALYIGISQSNPVNVCSDIEDMEDWPVDGYMITSPLYLRPSQAGMIEYFRKIAASTEKPIVLYNIPYRTGTNIENETLFELANLPNIVGVKDCSGNRQQSAEALCNAPTGFNVVTGEDGFFFDAVSNGSKGAIVTGAHVLANSYSAILKAWENGDETDALNEWNRVCHVPELLFAEPSPAPVKYWLWKTGLIESAEVRLPFLEIEQTLKVKIDHAIGELSGSNM